MVLDRLAQEKTKKESSEPVCFSNANVPSDYHIYDTGLNSSQLLRLLLSLSQEELLAQTVTQPLVKRRPWVLVYPI